MLCFFLVVGKARYHNLCLTLEKISSHFPYQLSLRDFTELEGPPNLIGFISHALMCKCLTNKSIAVCHFLLVSSNPHNIINVMDQCGMLWKERSIMIPAHLWHRVGELIYPCGRTMKVCCWLFQLQVHCFWWACGRVWSKRHVPD